MDPSRRSFRDDLQTKLSSIENVLRSVHLEPGRRDVAVRKLARLLGASGHAHGHLDVSQAASEVEQAPPFALPGAVDRLVVALRRVVADPALRRTCVLVVSIDPERRRSLQSGLAAADREVVSIAPAEVERLLPTKAVALLIVDVGPAPTDEGRALLVRLRARARGELLPIIALCPPDALAAGFEAGADTCLPVGAEPRVLRAATDAATRRVATLARVCRKDPLTGLLNRAGLAEAFVRVSASSARSGDVVSLAVIELDEGEALAAAPGEAARDDALGHLAAVLASVLRRDDLLASWEDDRLVALLPGPASGAVRALQKGLRALRHRPLELKRESMLVPLAFSAGVTEVVPPAALDEVVADAERRLWLARAAGRSGVHSEVAEPQVRPRILLALTDATRSAEVSHRLCREGFEVVREDEGAAALKLARAGGVTACVLDARLRGRDGFEVLERLRRGPVGARLPVLLVTSGGRDGDVARGFELGADDQLSMPFAASELVARVRRLLKRRPPTARLEGDRAGNVVGSFVGDQLVEFVQMLGISRKTGVVRVTCDTFSGALYLEQGRLVGASTSVGSPSLDAAFEVVLSPHGRFAFEAGLPIGVRRDLSIAIDAFLLEALRRRDDARRRTTGI